MHDDPIAKSRNRRTRLKRETYRRNNFPIMGYMGRLRPEQRRGIQRERQNMASFAEFPIILIFANLLFRPIRREDPTPIEETAPKSLSM